MRGQEHVLLKWMMVGLGTIGNGYLEQIINKRAGYTNIQHIEFELIKSSSIKRCYKKTNYLKLKINQIIKNMNLTQSEMSTILREFIRYDNIYATHRKRIKYDFILCIILKGIGKDVSKVKKFKPKLEKKRLKDFNELMQIN
jgi:homoserine dehydrogenase